MALPIKDTPFLEGEQAEEFLKVIVENQSKSISNEEYNRLKSSFESFNHDNL